MDFEFSHVKMIVQFYPRKVFQLGNFLEFILDNRDVSNADCLIFHWSLAGMDRIYLCTEQTICSHFFATTRNVTCLARFLQPYAI